jgi:hypothetical protein
MRVMAAPRKYPDELRERATRMAVEARRDPATRTATRPEAAARDCSHARCLQDGEHHFGSRPVGLTAKCSPHQLQV